MRVRRVAVGVTHEELETLRRGERVAPRQGLHVVIHTGHRRGLGSTYVRMVWSDGMVRCHGHML